MPKTVAILLAAGESRRMGQLKALLPWEGTTLIKHQVAALREGGVDRVIVVLGHRAPDLEKELQGQEGIVLALNPDYLQGKTTSIKTGLRAFATTSERDSTDADPPTSEPINNPIEAILLLNVDQPRSAETIALLLGRHRTSDAVITIPEYQGKGGHPIIFSGALLPELLQIEEATQGIRVVVQRHRAEMQRSAVENPEVLWDLNTPEQYAAARQE